jgi:Ca-activated chloride channel family protein
MWFLLAFGCTSAPPPADAAAVVLPEGRALVRTCPAPARRMPTGPLQRASEVDAGALADFALAPRPAPGRLDLTLVLDRSGSMEEEGRMNTVKAGIRAVAGRMVPGDRLAIVVFDNAPCAPLEDFVAGRDDPGLLADVVASIRPRGSTNLAAGLHEAYRVATRVPDLADATRLRRIVLVTDALLDEADVPASTTSEVDRAWDLYRIRLSTVAVGRRADGPLLQTLSARAQGRYGVIGVAEAVSARR